MFTKYLLLIYDQIASNKYLAIRDHSENITRGAGFWGWRGTPRFHNLSDGGVFMRVVQHISAAGKNGTRGRGSWCWDKICEYGGGSPLHPQPPPPLDPPDSTNIQNGGVHIMPILSWGHPDFTGENRKVSTLQECFLISPLLYYSSSSYYYYYYYY